MDRADLNLYGQMAAMKLLVAQALAIATREHDDPRGALADMLNATEQEFAEVMASLKLEHGAPELQTIEDAARDAVLYVGGLADSLLTHMGAPPAGGD